MTDHDPTHHILTLLTRSPLSLHELASMLRADYTTEQIDNALARLEAEQRVRYMTAVGLYTRGVNV